MNVVLLTQYFPPDLPGRIPEDIAQSLRSRGHDVRIVTTFPHYVTGRVAEGYRQRLGFVETYGQLPVRRVPIIPSHSGNSIGRIANYMSFALTARLAGSFAKGADVVYVHGTPATSAEPACAWSKSLGIPFVYHVQDIWPESVTESGFLPGPISSVTERILNKWLARIYRSASAVIAIAPTAQRVLIERGVTPDKCHLVFNWSDETDENSELQRLIPGKRSGLELIYAGNLGGFQDLETVIRAASELRGFDQFRLRIAGAGVEEERLRQLTALLGATDFIQFLGRLNRQQMAELYASADFQIVSLQDRQFFAGTIPSKFQTGLAHGLPLITTVKGDLTQIVRDHRLGFVASPEDVTSLAAAFRAAYATTREERQELSKRAWAYYRANLSKDTAISNIECILQSVAMSVDSGARR